MKLSITKISTYLDCPRKFWYTYDMRILTPKNEGFYFGSAIHEGLEAYYLGKDPMQGVKNALFGAKRNISEEAKEGIDLAKLKMEAKRIFSIYPQQAPYLKPLFIEHIFKVQLVNPETQEKLPAMFVGKMDLITADGKVVDHKTASNSPGDFFDARNTLQANGYSYAYLKMFEKLPSSFIINTIVKGNTRREPRFEPQIKRPTIGDICHFFDTCKTVLDALIRKETRDFTNPYHCRFCRYHDICPYAKRR